MNRKDKFVEINEILNTLKEVSNFNYGIGFIITLDNYETHKYYDVSNVVILNNKISFKGNIDFGVRVMTGQASYDLSCIIDIVVFFDMIIDKTTTGVK